jgi:hypothetical protein
VEWDNKPPKQPFDRFPVVGYRVQQRERTDEWFFVVEMDLVNDQLGPPGLPPARNEVDARARLAELGLAAPDIESRIAWARQWMATRILPPDGEPVLWLPPL